MPTEHEIDLTVFAKGAELIRTHEWQRGGGIPEITGCYCLAQSWYHQSGVSAGAYAVYVCDKLNLPNWEVGLSALEACFKWNDDPTRTKDEVLALLDSLAKGE